MFRFRYTTNKEIEAHLFRLESISETDFCLGDEPRPFLCSRTHSEDQSSGRETRERESINQSLGGGREVIKPWWGNKWTWLMSQISLNLLKVYLLVVRTLKDVRLPSLKGCHFKSILLTVHSDSSIETQNRLMITDIRVRFIKHSRWNFQFPNYSRQLEYLIYWGTYIYMHVYILTERKGRFWLDYYW
jgi:hypothetical protein